MGRFRRFLTNFKADGFVDGAGAHPLIPGSGYKDLFDDEFADQIGRGLPARIAITVAATEPNTGSIVQSYALAVIHDENMNGKLDTNRLGMPTEGYGFSNDAKAFLRAPSFSAASFPYDGRNLDLAISLNY